MIEEGATDDSFGHRQRLEKLLSRYKEILVLINETSARCSLTISSKIIHEKTTQIRTNLNQMSNVPTKYRDLSDVETTIQGQMKFMEIINKFRPQIAELKSEAAPLIQKGQLPQYVQKDLQQVEEMFQEKIRSAEEHRDRLDNVKDLWRTFDVNCRRFEQENERFNHDLSLIRANRTMIESFQSEIDRCQVSSNFSFYFLHNYRSSSPSVRRCRCPSSIDTVLFIIDFEPELISFLTEKC